MDRAAAITIKAQPIAGIKSFDACMAVRSCTEKIRGTVDLVRACTMKQTCHHIGNIHAGVGDGEDTAWDTETPKYDSSSKKMGLQAPNSLQLFNLVAPLPGLCCTFIMGYL